MCIIACIKYLYIRASNHMYQTEGTTVEMVGNVNAYSHVHVFSIGSMQGTTYWYISDQVHVDSSLIILIAIHFNV